MTFEELIKSALEKVPNDMDKREGSVMHMALAPACFELAQVYMQLAYMADRTYVDTSTGEDLDKCCADMGIYRKQATQAIRKGVFNVEVPIGSRFGLEDATYCVVEKIKDFEYKLECEQLGRIGNLYSGNLLPISYIKGLTTAELKDILIAGEDLESDDRLRERFYLNVRMPATSGNVHHYKIWATEVEGVGDAKIFPLWDGPGTVKVLITDTDKLPADRGLIDKVALHIEEVRPIGVSVSVVAPTPKNIDINATLEIGTDVLLESVKQNVKVKIQEYFKSITFKKNIISYAIIGSLILDVEGVVDYTDLKLNNTAANIKLTEEEIPAIGNIVVEV